MNREIKFRVFTGFEMCYDVLIGRFGVFYINPSNNGLDEKDSASLTRVNTKYPYDIPVMQYTGLKDKNGKEIYEGDIFCVAGNKEYQVRYCTGGESNFEWYGGCFILWGNDELFFPFDDFAIKNGIVIGNIYENPELL